MFGLFNKKEKKEAPVVKVAPVVPVEVNVPYSNNTHRGYPEIQIQFDGKQYRWTVVIYSYTASGSVLERTSGSNFTREEAKRNARVERNALLNKVEVL